MEPITKTKLHPRNKHNANYDFKALCSCLPSLKPFVKLNPSGLETIDFSNPEAVKSLNKALLKFFYQVDFWEIPENYLCPPIPGRADYIHYIADLLGEKTLQKDKVFCLDVGVGANCIYPILGSREYNWNFVGSDIDAVSLAAAQQIVDSNENLKTKVELRFQRSSRFMFEGVIRPEDYFDVSICNPPFHTSAEEASSGTRRKVKNLNPGKKAALSLNFGGQSNELWCDGGEEKFIRNMIFESKNFADSFGWFTTLVSKQSHLKAIYASLKKVSAKEVKTIPMAQGNKISRIVAWRFN